MRPSLANAWQEHLKERDWEVRELHMEQARLGADLQVARDEVLWLEHSNTQSEAQHGDLAGLEASLLQVLGIALSSHLLASRLAPRASRLAPRAAGVYARASVCHCSMRVLAAVLASVGPCCLHPFLLY